MQPLQTLIPLLYLVSAVLFIFGMKGLTKVKSARNGNAMASMAMLIAVVATLLEMGVVDYRWILVGLVLGGGIGLVAAVKVEMTQMPEMVALFNGFGGGASALVAMSTLWLEYVEPAAAGSPASVLGPDSAVTVALSVIIGALTLSGSIIAFMKLNGSMTGDPILLPARHVVNALVVIGALGLGLYMSFSITDTGTVALYCTIVAGLALLLGVFLVIPIGGADMPVVISLLNSYSGIAAAMTGFVIQNYMLIIAGALVGASGLILTNIMCVAMNRSLANVMFGGFGASDAGQAEDAREYSNVRSGGPEETAMLLDAAERVMFVPGYGLAVAQAQHAVREVADLLEARGATVEYAIHPVAGRMPGHMNVLLAEADVPYERLLEMDTANAAFKNVDVAIVVGANDVVNPVAEDPNSAIAGMPVLEVWNAQSVVVIKRSLSPGFAGIKNPLFEGENTMMLFSDAKAAIQETLTELKSL